MALSPRAQFPSKPGQIAGSRCAAGVAGAMIAGVTCSIAVQSTWRPAATCALALFVFTASADGVAPDTVESLRAELERMKAEQAARMVEMQRIEDRLAALEAAATSTAGAPAKPLPAASAQAAEVPSRFAVTGDFRLRYEGNFGSDVTGTWERGSLRARLGATYAATNSLTVGARLATGDPDDPNSSDVTLSNFADDFDVSLDLAYAALELGPAKLWGGKFLLPFTRTDLVWDGDVNPQGVAAAYGHGLGDATLRLSGLYFVVDQSVAGSDSSMVGGQVGFEVPITGALQLDVAVARYDYSLASIAGADAGDFRSNVIGPDGRYVSDFDLFNIVAGLGYTGWRDWPVNLTGDYVVNRGARVPGDTGYGIELAAGRSRARGDWRFGYGYSQAEVDAVLAAFSHDNTTIATNYRQHTLFAAYNLLDHVILDAIWYRYRPLDAAYAGLDAPGDWLDRVRLQVLVGF